MVIGGLMILGALFGSFFRQRDALLILLGLILLLLTGSRLSAASDQKDHS
jgi:hypothetical protein